MIFNTEDRLQAYCVKWFNNEYPAWRGLLFAIPNGGLRDKRTANLLVATGVVAGVSDLCLIMPEGKTVWIETKLPYNDKSNAQEIWERKIMERGHIYLVYKSFEEFKNIIWQIIGKY